MAIDHQLVSEYKRKIERELVGYQEYAQETEASYSREYEIFKQEQIGKSHLLFERLCNWAGGILRIQVAEGEYYKLFGDMKLAHLETTPQNVYALAYLLAIASVVISGALSLALRNVYVIAVGLVITIIGLLYVPSIPKLILASWRARTSDQLVLAVLYIVIYMQHTPNLERAIKFVAEHMGPPLSLDFMKILWDIDTKKYSTIEDALEEYIVTWRGWDDEFIESIHLIKSSLSEPDIRRKRELLDNSIKIILDGTQNHMLDYAHQLQGPMEALHMLGVVLPVMGLVMLPMISAFMGESVKWYYVALFYNVLLPIIVYAIGRSVLATRPAGSDISDVYKYIQQKYKTPTVNLFGTEITMPAWFVGILVFVLLSLPAFIYFPYMFSLVGEGFVAELYSTRALLFSLDFVLGLGLGFGAYYWWAVRHIIQVKKDIEKMEGEFSAAVFQLGEKLEQHQPPEKVIITLSETMQASEISKMFKAIAYNMTSLGASLKEAIFNKQYGAVTFYPSAIIKSTLSLFVESAKKGPVIAGRAMLTISEYLETVQRVSRRLQDLLTETVSSMISQVKVFVPLISAIVVGLASLTTTIMINLSRQIKTFSTQLPGSDTSSALSGAGGSGLIDIFQIDSMVPQFIFQFVVGIYIIEIIYILTFLLSGIIYGHDEIEQKDSMAKNFLMATPFYVIAAVLISLLLGALVGPITQLKFE